MQLTDWEPKKGMSEYKCVFDLRTGIIVYLVNIA